MPALLKLTRWCATKLFGAAVIIGLGVGAVGLWMFLRETADLDQLQAARLQGLLERREALEQVRSRGEAQVAEVVAELGAQQRRLEQAEKVVETLRALESWWDRLWGNTGQQQANAEQIQRMRDVAQHTRNRLLALQAQRSQLRGEMETLERTLGRLDGEIREVEESRSVALHYLRRAWAASKWYAGAALAGFVLGPTVWSLLLFYGFAAVVARGRPIQLANQAAPLPLVGASQVSHAVTLQPGEILRLREKFLQASDEGARKRTRFVMDWRIPLTSFACGLVELVELVAQERACRVTLSNGDDPHVEVAVIDLPAGSSIILRPSFLVGVVHRVGEPLRIQRHWQFARWQAWAGGQFRFFEFLGPCRLIVAGSRGVRAERLSAGDAGTRPVRRTNQDATIGFTPNLAYQPVRAETFWGYYRSMNPLFDDRFAGEGMFLVQETSAPGSAATAGRFWSGVWNGLLKIFGL